MTGSQGEVDETVSHQEREMTSSKGEQRVISSLAVEGTISSSVRRRERWRTS